MSENALGQCLQKMRAAGISEAAIDNFGHYWQLCASGATGLIREDSIRPLLDPPQLDQVEVSEDAARSALQQTVMIKLNGGLGTSMGMDRAKSLLPVRGGKTFLDLIAARCWRPRADDGRPAAAGPHEQLPHAEDTARGARRLPGPGRRRACRSTSSRTASPSCAPTTSPRSSGRQTRPSSGARRVTATCTRPSSVVLRTHCSTRASGTRPCPTRTTSAPPPTHGSPGGSRPPARPFAAEVARRTAADRKGGHLVVRDADGRLVLRESAQTLRRTPVPRATSTPASSTPTTSGSTSGAAAELDRTGGVLHLPLIRNEKTVDPSDKTSPKVVQIESAMGAAIEVFDGAVVLEVDRVAVPAGEDDERPAGPAVRRVRAR